VEQQTHFSLWAALKSPLMLSTNISRLSPEQVAMLTNSEVIAIDQDALGVQAHRVQLDVATDDISAQLPLSPATLSCSNAAGLIAPGQQWCVRASWAALSAACV